MAERPICIGFNAFPILKTNAVMTIRVAIGCPRSDNTFSRKDSEQKKKPFDAVIKSDNVNSMSKKQILNLFSF